MRLLSVVKNNKYMKYERLFNFPCVKNTQPLKFPSAHVSTTLDMDTIMFVLVLSTLLHSSNYKLNDGFFLNASYNTSSEFCLPPFTKSISLLNTNNIFLSFGVFLLSTKSLKIDMP